MGTARAPVAGSGFCPACRERVLKPIWRSGVDSGIPTSLTVTLFSRGLHFSGSPRCRFGSPSASDSWWEGPSQGLCADPAAHGGQASAAVPRTVGQLLLKNRQAGG